MIRSMTGYGKSQAVVDGRACTIEIRAVNGRFLETTVRLPKEWADKEQPIREKIREGVSRGSVSIFIRAEEAPSEAAPSINITAAKAIYQRLVAVRDALGLAEEVTLQHVLQFEDELASGSAEETVAEEKTDVWPALEQGLQEALTGFTDMRDREGLALLHDFLQRLVAIETALVDVEAYSAGRLPFERERLRERVRQITHGEELDEIRMNMEIVLLADKLDIAEEAVRLKSHIEAFRQYVAEEQSPGRKLNFLLQEMNREVNTIGSKCNDAGIARLVVGMKEELERMREQVQNVE